MLHSLVVYSSIEVQGVVDESLRERWEMVCAYKGFLSHSCSGADHYVDGCEIDEASRAFLGVLPFVGWWPRNLCVGDMPSICEVGHRCDGVHHEQGGLQKEGDLAGNRHSPTHHS